MFHDAGLRAFDLGGDVTLPVKRSELDLFEAVSECWRQRHLSAEAIAGVITQSS
jgi:hypothetical protein